MFGITQYWSAEKIATLGRIAVLKGGVAAEREISLISGQAVYQALESVGADVQCFDVRSLAEIEAAAQQADLVFIALHGRWGEDGTVQAILDSLGVAYTGSGMAASAIAMDKLRTKWLWQGAGIPTPQFIYVANDHPFKADDFQIPFPVMIKPAHEGSSIGMRKAHNLEELTAAIAFAQDYDTTVLIEQWITGREFTCAFLADQTLPLIELKTQNDFYDFEAKYQSNSTQYLCPVELPQEKQQEIARWVKLASETVGVQDWGRVDLLLDEQQRPWLIEINTVPGMTDHSLVPMAAKQAGITFESLVLNLLALAKNKIKTVAPRDHIA